jgi:hypothetical protein
LQFYGPKPIVHLVPIFWRYVCHNLCEGVKQEYRDEEKEWGEGREHKNENLYEVGFCSSHL